MSIADGHSHAAWSTMRADRRFLWFWLSVATLLSVAGNVGHAWLTVGESATRSMAIGWAGRPGKETRSPRRPPKRSER